MAVTQTFFLCILPHKWAESMEAKSREWKFRCPCGFEQSWWDAGGIRWKAAGHPRWLMQCPQCGKTTWHVTVVTEEGG